MKRFLLVSMVDMAILAIGMGDAFAGSKKGKKGGGEVEDQGPQGPQGKPGAPGEPGLQGPQGKEGAPGESGVSGWERVQSDSCSNSGADFTCTAACTGSKKVLGGGWSGLSSTDLSKWVPDESYPSSDTEWTVGWTRQSGMSGLSGFAWAICADVQ